MVHFIVLVLDLSSASLLISLQLNYLERSKRTGSFVKYIDTLMLIEKSSKMVLTSNSNLFNSSRRIKGSMDTLRKHSFKGFFEFLEPFYFRDSIARVP